MLFLLHLYAG